MRKIIHIDMDAFYASVEQRDDPQLRGKPVAVGGNSDRGVVAAASYEARKYGVRSAMPSVIAARQCPHIIFVAPRFDVYKSVSNEIREIFYDYTDLVEPLSLDEAYLDVTHNKKGMPSATLIAKEIKQRIKDKTRLTASAGISINKFLAKVASDVKKPDGLFLVAPEDAVAFVEKLPIEKFFGIGKVTAEKMHKIGIRNGADLKKYSLKELRHRFGKSGSYYYKIARAEDDREVNPNRIRKSLSAENTFEKDLTTYDEARQELDEIGTILFKRMKKNNTIGRTLSLKVKYNDFQIASRSKTEDHWITEIEEIKRIFLALIDEIDLKNGIRLLGLTISNLNNEPEDPIEGKAGMQLTLRF